MTKQRTGENLQPAPEEDRLIYRAHELYAREARRAKRREGVDYSAPSGRLTTVDWTNEEHPVVVIRNGHQVLAEYRWGGERLRRFAG